MDEWAKMRATVVAAVCYVGIMALGMFTAGHLFDIIYGDPAMVKVLVFFEVVLSLFAVVMARRIFGTWQCGFEPIDWSGIMWMVPNFAVIAALFAALFSTGAPISSGLTLLVILTMILVGFSEELMFRGVALKGALATLPQGKAILLSAALFSLLHSVNVLAFVPIEGMLYQLALTFVFGLAMASFALRLNSLIPLIVFHTLWDMVQFLGGLWGANFWHLVDIGIAVNALSGAVLWWSVLRKRKAATMAQG